MKFIYLLSIVSLYCCTCKHAKQENTLTNAELLSHLSLSSKLEDSLFGDKLSDTFRKWFPVWDTVLVNDHKYRGAGTFFDSLKQQKKLDSINQGIVTDFLDKYGYPGRYQVSSTGKYAIFIVIQHAPIETQERYYPIFVQGYKDNKFYGFGLALLEDRINMWRHRKQYYGTQHQKNQDGEDYLYPVVNPDSINAWRKQISAGYIINDTTDYSIEREYKDLYQSKWDVDKYKKELPDLIKKFKVTDSPSIRFVRQP